MTDFPYDRLPSRAADIETRTASEVLDEIEAGLDTHWHDVLLRVVVGIAGLCFLALLWMGPVS